MSRWLIYCCLIISGLTSALAVEGAAFPQIWPGMTYRAERLGDEPLSLVMVTIARDHPEFRFTTTLAQGSILGLASVPEQVKTIPTELGIPVAAINGDWFEINPRPYQGDLINLLIHRGELVSLPSWGNAFWIDNKGVPHLDQVQTSLQSILPDGKRIDIGLDGPRAEDAVVLYSPIFGNSTHTTGGKEYLLERAADGPWLPLRIGSRITARVREVRGENSPLAADLLILSVGPKAAGFNELRAGDLVSIDAASKPDLSGVEFALGGGPILLRNSEVLPRAPQDEPRHPRTILGWNEHAYFLIVIDGRRDGWSRGLSVPELSQLAKRLGLTDAISLDGGGSSTLWMNDQVMNMPSDGQPRNVANALVVVRVEPAVK